MSYGGQSNAPWQRNVMQGHPQGGYNQGSQMYMQNVQQSNMAAYGHVSGSGGNIFPGGGGAGNSVSYPPPRSGVNPVAFQQGGNSTTHYNSIGIVTKMSHDCGLVNNEIFFYRNVCKGPEPEVGDRVIFEASYSNSGQFEWNATRVQLMQQPQPLITANKNNYSSVAPPNEYQRNQVRRQSPKRSPVRARPDNRNRERLHRSRDRAEEEHERKKRREERSHDRGAGVSNRTGVVANEGRSGNAARIEKERDRAESRKKDREIVAHEREDRIRERKRERTRELEVNRAGPTVRRGRATKHYMVKMPKTLLSIKTADVQELHQRYNSLYIPSDFFHANIKWSDTFPPDNPFSLRRPCQFHIMHEIVESPIEQNNDLLEPADANYLYSAKVMLMSLPPIAEIYKKCFENADDNDDHHAVHPTRLINFLVGVKGRVGSMAIGGPWSPSLDGKNPDKDPSVLIRTAIRTCKALTGIDLSNCTQWYRFVELYYHRTEYKNMEKDGPPRVETVVIYLPDVHSCMPSIDEWQTLTQFYKNAADGIITRRAALVAAAAANSNDDNDKTQDVEMADNSTLNDEGAGAAAGEDLKEKSTDNDENCAENNDEDAEDLQEEEEENMDASTVSVDLTDAGDGDNDGVEEEAGAEDGDTAEDTTAAEDENVEPTPEPTHYSLLDLKAMKVQEIRDELLARNLPDTGVRNVIMARLAKALNTEKAVEAKNKTTNKQKAVAVKKSNEENMEVDSESHSKVENKNKNEKKTSKESNGDVTATKSPKGKKNAANAKNKNVNEKDDNVDWADIIDFELSDIVILDEYDSSKNVDETNLKEMSEKEKARLIRHHTLPSTPHIVVHPNKTAKDGKFDCAIMSLSVLLDYHPDDSKERFFEVSLFAELFNEMLMRDFGFNIYKEFCLYEENESNACEIADIKPKRDDNKMEKTENNDEVKKEKDNEKEKEKSSQNDSKASNEDKSGKEPQQNDDLQTNKSESRKRKISTSNSIANGNEHQLAASGKKMVVVKPQLLLSFIYFDTTYCGYIYDKHLEELFYVLGLNLSRSQIKNVLGKLRKLTSGQSIFYRKLTDKEAPLEATPAIEDVYDLSSDEYKRIAAGNNQYATAFGRKTVHDQISAIEGDGDNKEGLINFNGTIVHVGKLLTQINRTEKNYSDLEKLYNDLLKQHNDLQKDHNKTSTKIKDLQSEIKSVSRKLTDANQDFYSLNRKYRDQHSTLSYIYTRVEPYFAREKDKDKDAKSEGSRDKEKNDKEKENDKSKDKECEKEKVIKKEDNKNKEMVVNKDDNANQVANDAKDEEEKNKIKDDKVNEQEKVKDNKDNVKEKLKDNKEKEQVKSDKEKPKDEVQKEKAKEDNKEKQTAKADKVKQTPQKTVVQKPKPATPAAKKQIGGTKLTGKIVKKSENAGTAKK